MTSLDELSDLEQAVTPTSLREWLALEGWSLTDARPGLAETWTSAAALGRIGIRDVFLPLNPNYGDYSRRFRETLDDLRQAYEVSLPDLVERVASVSSDLFFVRVDQITKDSTIPFHQATDLMTGIQRMVRAAATTAADPSHSHMGRRPAKVTEFMEDDLRFGHTKRGSFIITVAARLERESVSADTTGRSVIATTSHVEPFQRQVMRTLASGLVATSDYLNNRVQSEQDVVSRGGSAELVQSVIDVTEAEGRRSVDLSFEWAAREPITNGVETVSVKADRVERLEALRASLTKTEVPSEETLIGRVAELGRDNLPGGQEENWIILEAELDGRLRKIRVKLLDSDYEWAIWAHQNRMPFTVTGIPSRRRSWTIEGYGVVDLSFLRNRRYPKP